MPADPRREGRRISGGLNPEFKNPEEGGRVAGEPTRGWSLTTRGSRQKTRRSSLSPRGARVTTPGFCDATGGYCVSTCGFYDSTRGSCNATVGSCVSTHGSCVFTRSFRGPVGGFSVPTRGLSRKTPRLRRVCRGSRGSSGLGCDATLRPGRETRRSGRQALAARRRLAPRLLPCGSSGPDVWS